MTRDQEKAALKAARKVLGTKSNVEYLNVVTTLDSNPDNILDAAKGNLESVLVIGWDKEGEPYFSASMADGGDCLWLIEKCKKALLEM